MALEGREAWYALGALALAAVGVSIWVKSTPPTASPAPTPTPPAAVTRDESEPSPTGLPAVEPTPQAAETFGSVYEVTIARPRPTATPAEEEPPPMDIRRVDQKDVSPPVLLHRVEPAYPEIARRGRAEGQVIVEAVIDEHGAVQDPRIVHSTTIPLLNEEALRAVRQWSYQPATYRGKFVRVYVTVTVTFRLN